MHNDQVGMTQLSSVFTKSALPFFIFILVIVTTINLTIITDDSSGNEGKPLLYVYRLVAYLMWTILQQPTPGIALFVGSWQFFAASIYDATIMVK